MLTPERVAEPVLPAISVAVPVALWPAASVLIVTGGSTEATPEVVSVTEKVTVTSALYHPLALAARSGVAVTIGGVLSILMPDITVLAELPALSVAMPVTDWSAPSPVRVVSGVTESIPEPEGSSDAVKWTVTSVLYQPLVLGEVVGAPDIIG